MITEKEIKEAISFVGKAGIKKNQDLFSKTRDIFQARIDTFTSRTSKFLESAIIAELGNNTFDHNFIFDEKHSRGAFFYFDEINTVILADYGQGIKNSLSNLYNLSSDLDAIKLAFLEHVTSRSKENRGNGLKFVTDSVIENNFELFLQSGTGCCHIEQKQINFYNRSDSIIGCLIIFKF